MKNTNDNRVARNGKVVRTEAELVADLATVKAEVARLAKLPDSEENDAAFFAARTEESRVSGLLSFVRGEAESRARVEAEAAAKARIAARAKAERDHDR